MITWGEIIVPFCWSIWKDNAEGASKHANLSGKKTLVGRTSGESLHK